MAMIRIKLKLSGFGIAMLKKSFYGSQIPMTTGLFAVRILAGLFVFS